MIKELNSFVKSIENDIINNDHPIYRQSYYVNDKYIFFEYHKEQKSFVTFSNVDLNSIFQLFNNANKADIFSKTQDAINFYYDVIIKSDMYIDVKDFHIPNINSNLFEFRVPLKDRHVKANRNDFYKANIYEIPIIKLQPKIYVDSNNMDFSIEIKFPLARKQFFSIDIKKDSDMTIINETIIEEIRKRIFVIINLKEKRIKKNEFKALSFDDVCQYVTLFDMIDC